MGWDEDKSEANEKIAGGRGINTSKRARRILREEGTEMHLLDQAAENDVFVLGFCTV